MELDAEHVEGFRQWLRDHTTLSTRAISDTISRLRRLKTFIDPLEVGSKAEMEFRLQQSSEWGDLQASVRSQLKKAGLLYRQFVQSTAHSAKSSS